MDPELLSIGRFARLSGLSIGALRHYHEVGLLEPARVDQQTGYRSYVRAQLDDARLVGRLRELDVALPEIRSIVAADADARRQLLAAHRSRLMGQLSRIQRQLHWLTQSIDHEEPIMTTAIPTEIDPGTHRALAADLFNHVWTLLELPSRTADQVDEMIHAAHASRHHWGVVGEPFNLARGEWQCSRVYAVLGRAEPALWHARRCLAVCEEHGIGDFDIAFAWEAIARGAAVAGDEAMRGEAMARARELAADISDAEDRELVLSDLETI